ncbi:heterokaryon incompatibility domain-containing protein [Trichoderma barbatum]
MSFQDSKSVGGSGMLYQQLPLNDLEIRLLRLQPSAGSTEIRASITKCSLPELKNGSYFFKALSYTWGQASVTKKIVINAIAFPVTANLYAFLQQYRETDPDVDLWIDAICINQNDLLEKNHQIPIMNMIYAKARALIIWLGESSSDSDLALEWISDLGRSSPYEKMPDIPNNAWQAMQSLFERPWWKRIWIVQELTIGAMGKKLENASIICGRACVSWISVVVAAARMKAYQHDKRQAFPTITEILELDSLRDSAGHYLMNEPSTMALFDLICRYRHFLATNRRDKIYAIWNMFAKVPSKRLQSRYDRSVEEIYVYFATEILSGEAGLEALRHCANGSPDVPSWAPDWSAPLGSLSLPFRKIPRYFDVPWWAEPDFQDPSGAISDKRTREDSRVIYRIHPLVIDAEENLSDIPNHFVFHKQFPATFKEQLSELLLRDDFLYVIADDKGNLPETLDAVQQGELINERNLKEWLLQELRHSTTKPLYTTATLASASFKINKNEKSLQVKGILWDELEVCHESFVEDIERNFANATRFMVAVGCCKHLAMSNKSSSNKYPNAAKLLEAFWSTLVVGQTIENECTGEAQNQLLYEGWLPEIPKSWAPGEPPVTAKTTGLVILAEMTESMDRPTSVFNVEQEGGNLRFTHSLDSQLKELVFPPNNDKYAALVFQLASLWHRQPYDLYHRPFNLSNVIPDPYWEYRRHKDELAKQQAKNRRSICIRSRINSNLDSSDQEFLRRASDDVDEALKQKPSLVPQDTLPAGIEKYALGRRFFITKRGYFGLGPQKSEPGDRVAVLFGSCVPFVLRKSVTATGKRA